MTRIPIDDPQAVKRFLNNLLEERVGIAPDVVDLIFDDMADDMQTLAKMKLTANESVDTGLLRGSITVDRGSGPPNIKKIIGTNVEYSLHVEYGTSPHMIDGPVLIKTKDDAKGFWRYIKMHKGSREKPFMRPAFNEVKNKMNEYVLPYFE